MSIHDQPVSSAVDTTATVVLQEDEIDEQNAYLRDVLGLSEGETEDRLDKRLKDNAVQLGIDLDALPTDTPSSTESTSTQSLQTCSSDLPRRSESICSQSTGLTSIHSELSHDRRRTGASSCSRFRRSLISKDHDGFFRRSISNGRSSVSSFTPPTTPPRTLYHSVPLEPPPPSLPLKKSLGSRRMKALNVLKLVRPDVSPVRKDCCPHCRWGDKSSEKRAIHHLPCGHRLCTEALRNLVQNGTSGDIRDRPMCCNLQIPRNLVEQVLTECERHVWLDRLEHWGNGEAMSAVIPSLPRMSVGVQCRPGTRSPLGRMPSDDSRVDSVASSATDDLEWVRGREDYQQALQEQSTLRDRFEKWAEVRRATKEAGFAKLREHIVETQTSVVSLLAEQHACAVIEAEDKQVKAEADLREVHAQQKRDNATALKYLEAHCAGTYSNGEAHHRPIIEQALIELEKTRRTRDTMNNRHNSAINVLRGEQSRRMKSRIQRQDREMRDLERVHESEKTAFDQASAEEIQQLNERTAMRLQRLKSRWILQMAILGRNIENETSRTIAGGLPTADWMSSTYELSRCAPGVSLVMNTLT